MKGEKLPLASRAMVLLAAGIVGGLIIIAVAGLGWFLSRHAGKDLEAYYLGGKGVPWYWLRISHGVSGLDVSGTMWLMVFASRAATRMLIRSLSLLGSV